MDKPRTLLVTDQAVDLTIVKACCDLCDTADVNPVEWQARIDACARVCLAPTRRG